MPTYFRVTSGHLMFTPRGRIVISRKSEPNEKLTGVKEVRTPKVTLFRLNFHKPVLVRYLIKSQNGTIFGEITTYVRFCAYMNFHVCNSDHEVVGVVAVLQPLFVNFDKLCLKVVYIVRLDLMQDGRTQ